MRWGGETKDDAAAGAGPPPVAMKAWRNYNPHQGLIKGRLQAGPPLYWETQIRGSLAFPNTGRSAN
jgi:hypothetical protein